MSEKQEMDREEKLQKMMDDFEEKSPGVKEVLSLNKELDRKSRQEKGRSDNTIVTNSAK